VRVLFLPASVRFRLEVNELSRKTPFPAVHF